VLGVITTLALFLSVFGHELSHALVGRMEGIEIEEIVLHPFGGLARLKSQPETPGAEFRIAVGGPFVSAVAVAGPLAAAALAALPESVEGTLRWVGYVNAAMLAVNLLPLPGFDGGRILHAVLWEMSGDPVGATRRSIAIGRVLTYVLLGGGLAFVVLTLLT
jgi:Zn-dependent protease